jgi:hypothetical protein
VLSTSQQLERRKRSERNQVSHLAYSAALWVSGANFIALIQFASTGQTNVRSWMARPGMIMMAGSVPLLVACALEVEFRKLSVGPLIISGVPGVIGIGFTLTAFAGWVGTAFVIATAIASWWIVLILLRASRVDR